MTRDAAKTLFHPFATMLLTPPAKDERVLFLGAETGYELPDEFDGAFTAVQSFRPLYNGLMKRGIEAQPFSEGDDYNMALVLMNKHRGANENFLVDALKRVRPGGRIVVAGSKEDGVQSLRKRVAALELETEHLAKYHAQAFWFVRPDNADTAIAALAQPEAFVLDRFVTAPGMFSHGEADAGSVFLTRYLPKGFKKLAADFGAGWGFLTAELYKASPEIEGVDLYEADHAAMEAARRNLNVLAPKLSARYFWHDLAREEVKNRYDLIIMNPPFHEGHASEPQLGQAIIKTAATALKTGGELLLVANRGLSYEPTLKELFKTSSEVARNARYKVLSGKK
ncbi:MAG: methyltransferase [Rhizobium sp.]|nr:methyltransferase [Rhizobium sp.]